MKQLILSIFVFTIFVLLGSCNKEEVYANIDLAITSVEDLPAPPAPHAALLVGSTPVEVTDGAITYQCEEKTYSLANNMNEVVAFSPNGGTLFPGSLVQGKYVRDGILNAIGTFPRAPLKINMDGYGISQTVESPSQSTVDAAIIGMISNNTISTEARMSYRLVESHSTEQALLELGIDYEWGINSVSPAFGKSNSVSESVVIMAFTQAYYTISIDQPASPSDFFDDGTDPEALKAKVYEGNPLCYLSSVTYGRMVLVSIKAKATSEALTAAINAGIGPIGGSINYTNQTILENATYDAVIIGGNSSDAITAVQNIKSNGLEALDYFLDAGANFSVSSRGLPIAYTVRHAANNTLVKMGSALTYTTRENCFYDPNDFLTVQVKIDSIQVVYDCDPGLFDGAGELSYDFKIYNGNTLVKDGITGGGDYYDGGLMKIDAGPYDVTLTNKSGNSLFIKGTIRDDEGSYYQYVNVPDIEFSYPFNDITSNYASWYQQIDGGSGCYMVLWFSLRRKP